MRTRRATLAVVLLVGATCFAAGWWLRGTSSDALPAPPSRPVRAHGPAPEGPVLEAGAPASLAAPQSEKSPERGTAEQATAAATAGSATTGLLPVDVRLPDGSPAETFTIVAESAADTYTWAWSRAQGPLPVNGGAYEVHARAGPHGVHRSPRRGVLVPESGSAPSVRLECEKGTALVVHVQAKRDSSFGKPIVELLALAPEAEIEPERLRNDGRSESAEPGKDGWAAIVFRELAPGRYALGVKTWWSGPYVETAVVTVTQGLIEHRFVLPPLADADVVIVRVLGPDGRDLPNPLFGLQYEGNSRGGDLEPAPALRQADGRWKIPVRLGDIDGDPKAQVTLRVTARGLGQRRVDLTGAGGRSIVVGLDEGNVLAVELIGAARDPRSSGLRVDLHEKTGEGSSTRATATSFDAEGRHVFEARQPGPAEIRVMLVRGQREWPVAARQLVTTSGAQRVTIPLPRLHRVVFTNANPNQTLGLQWEIDGAMESFWFDVDAEGRAVIDGLPEGEYQTRLELDSPFKTFRVTGPSEFALR